MVKNIANCDFISLTIGAWRGEGKHQKGYGRWNQLWHFQGEASYESQSYTKKAYG